ncbi:hypothetical protein NQ314_016658 [Rhamnusium bicolor]|uniref:Carboxylesterase type B domain-containing protein n=1 Tax=Rhamnusium bicolor TaxID=1586634 RepID=A0AAV8WVX9_9CUCU|nr:hypothetical protein NQ314_016658 [Rhamnusium bicolor]
MSGASSFKSVFQSVVSKLPSSEQEGVAHADDLFYLFPNFFTPKILPGSKEDVYIQRFVKIWTNFARYGNPTPQEDDSLNRVLWTPIESENIEIFLEIGEELKLIKNLDEERIKFWDNIYEQSSNE